MSVEAALVGVCYFFFLQTSVGIWILTRLVPWRRTLPTLILNALGFAGSLLFSLIFDFGITYWVPYVFAVILFWNVALVVRSKAAEEAGETPRRENR